jgi:phosphatidylglycerophosphate synthase
MAFAPPQAEPNVPDFRVHDECGNHTRHLDYVTSYGGSVTVRDYPVTDVSGRDVPVGLIVQFVVLAALASAVGLATAGWLIGTTVALVTCGALNVAMRRYEMRALGPANQVTLGRATLVGGVAALVADSCVSGRAPVIVLVTLATVALALDAVDGQVARRTGTSSPLGARFDMEVDAFLILVLSVYVARSMGVWVLAIGATRYAFVAAAWALPWLQEDLPARFSRKTVAALQGVVLVVVSAGVLPGSWAIVAVALALALLTWSFGRDIRWLWQVRPLAMDRPLVMTMAGQSLELAGGGPH